MTLAKMDNVRVAARTILVLCLIGNISAVELFRKYIGYKLGTTSDVISVHPVRGTFGCEKLCLEYGRNQCAGANVIHTDRNMYSCEIFSTVPVEVTGAVLLPNTRGKFIKNIGMLERDSRRPAT
jgi:hypothetical protein